MRFNPKTGDYFVTTLDPIKAKDTGLTLSTNTSGPMGESVYFTQDPYAALNFYREADPDCASRLLPLWNDYEASWAIESPNSYPMANGIILRPYQNAAIDYVHRKM